MKNERSIVHVREVRVHEESLEGAGERVGHSRTTRMADVYSAGMGLRGNGIGRRTPRIPSCRRVADRWPLAWRQRAVLDRAALPGRRADAGQQLAIWGLRKRAPEVQTTATVAGWSLSRAFQLNDRSLAEPGLSKFGWTASTPPDKHEPSALCSDSKPSLLGAPSSARPDPSCHAAAVFLESCLLGMCPIRFPTRPA